MNRSKHLETILVLVLALVVVYWLRHVKSPETARYFLLAAVIIGAIGVFIPSLADKIHWAWMKLAHGMGWVMSKVILTIVFFVFLLPMALLFRAFGKTTVQMKPGGDSYYKERNFVYTKESLENVW